MSWLDYNENMATKHRFPVGSKVSYRAPSSRDDGVLRAVLFVIEHQRDCDGTPMYLLAARVEPYDPDWKLYSEEYLRWHMHSGFVVGMVSERQLSQ